MGYNRRKMEAQRAVAAEKKAAARRGETRRAAGLILTPRPLSRGGIGDGVRRLLISIASCSRR
jgi:hypothetical protein